MKLFKERDNLPAFLAMSLPEATTQGWLHLFELLHPIHRLLDFWCGHPDRGQPFTPVAEWTIADWQEAQVQIPAQLKTPQVKAELVKSIEQLQQFEVNNHLRISEEPVSIDSITAACLLPLWEKAQP